MDNYGGSITLQLEPLNAERINKYLPLVLHENLGALSDNSITSLLMWANPLDIRQRLIGNSLFFDIRYTTGQRWLMQPSFKEFSPDDVERALAIYPEHSFITLSQEFADLLRESLPDRFKFSMMDGYGDYIYERALLADEFFYENIDKSFRPSFLKRLISENDIVFERFEDASTHLGGTPVECFYTQIATKNELLGGELYGIRSLMSARQPVATAMSGRMMINGKLAGVILCGAINEEMLDITFIKNDHSMRGSGVLLLHLAAKEFSGYRYMNYQEDMNIPSLRRYKSALNPCMVSEKYMALRSDR